MALTAMEMSPCPVISTTGRLRSLAVPSASRQLPGRRCRQANTPMTMPRNHRRSRQRLFGTADAFAGNVSSARAGSSPSRTWGTTSSRSERQVAVHGSRLIHVDSVFASVRAHRSGRHRTKVVPPSAGARRSESTGGCPRLADRVRPRPRPWAARLGGEERFEQVLARFSRCRGRCRNRQPITTLGDFAVQPQFGQRLGLRMSRCVADQVDEELLQAGLIDLQRHSSNCS